MKGTHTAIITPFIDGELDVAGFNQLLDFQIENKISGILVTGTTGESPTLRWEEHNLLMDILNSKVQDKIFKIAGVGSNSTEETLKGTKEAIDANMDAVLLVEPYYNGPSSLEMREEYFGYVAKKFSDIQIIPYTIPGRTGTQIFPEDLAYLNKKFKNINSVKEATGNLENMKKIRSLCKDDFIILSGDDNLTAQIIEDEKICAGGVISVVSNFAPRAVSDMVRFFAEGNNEEAKKIDKKLKPLFNIVSFNSSEESEFGKTNFKARNPLPCKTAMQILGMPSGMCRRPIGKLTKNALKTVVQALCLVYEESPEILSPIEKFFDVDLKDRLYNEDYWKELSY